MKEYSFFNTATQYVIVHNNILLPNLVFQSGSKYNCYSPSARSQTKWGKNCVVVEENLKITI